MSDRRKPIDDSALLSSPSEDARSDFGGAFERLVGIMAKLRGPGGCPWDREQTLDSLKPYLIEEAYEVLEAIEHASTDDHLEELGDLLLQVVFHSELMREQGVFDAADVAHGISDKLVRRHPHVFGDATATNTHEVLRRWESIKASEKSGRSAIDGVPRALPALLRAQRTTEKASRVGFDWPDASGVLLKLREEVDELHEAAQQADPTRIADELGDVLFTLVNAARFFDVNAEDALHGAVERFRRRFFSVETNLRDRGIAMKDTGIEELERLWQLAKSSEAPRPGGEEESS